MAKQKLIDYALLTAFGASIIFLIALAMPEPERPHLDLAGNIQWAQFAYLRNI